MVPCASCCVPCAVFSDRTILSAGASRSEKDKIALFASWSRHATTPNADTDAYIAYILYTHWLGHASVTHHPSYLDWHTRFDTVSGHLHHQSNTETYLV